MVTYQPPNYLLLQFNEILKIAVSLYQKVVFPAFKTLFKFYVSDKLLEYIAIE